MSDIAFTIDGAETAPYALAPTIDFALRVDDLAPTRGSSAPGPIQSVQLRTQVRIEPERRRYTPEEEARLLGLFGTPDRWADTLQPFLWTHVTIPVGRFTGTSSQVTLPVECSYDLEVTIGQYLHSLADGDIPLIFLFSGTVFRRGPTGTTIEQIDWDRGEARFRLPATLWRATMDTVFPGGGWLRLQRGTLDRLVAFKARQGIPTWDATLELLLDTTTVDPAEVEA